MKNRHTPDISDTTSEESDMEFADLTSRDNLEERLEGIKETALNGIWCIWGNHWVDSDSPDNYTFEELIRAGGPRAIEEYLETLDEDGEFDKGEFVEIPEISEIVALYLELVDHIRNIASEIRTAGCKASQTEKNAQLRFLENLVRTLEEEIDHGNRTVLNPKYTLIKPFPVKFSKNCGSVFRTYRKQDQMPMEGLKLLPLLLSAGWKHSHADKFLYEYRRTGKIIACGKTVPDGAIGILPGGLTVEIVTDTGKRAAGPKKQKKAFKVPTDTGKGLSSFAKTVRYGL